MRYYNQPHGFYCGVDLHATTMYLCILDHAGQVVFHKDLPTNPDAFLEAIDPYRDDLVVCCECLFCWYRLADLCHDENIAFVLGHALYMRAIYGAKTKDDKIDSEKIARLLRGGSLPYAYVYPKGLRETRDLLRRRMYPVRKRAELITHVVNTNTQYNLPPFGKKLMYARNRKELNILKRFSDPSVRANIELDLRLLDTRTVTGRGQSDDECLLAICWLAGRPTKVTNYADRGGVARLRFFRKRIACRPVPLSPRGGSSRPFEAPPAGTR
jgi:hypothetical protein